MFDNIGSVYKEIRKSKHLTQSKVCEGILSRSNLASFEANLSMPSFETMNLLLRQIDMPWEEFKYICNQYQPDEWQQIMLDTDKNILNFNTPKLKKLQRRCQHYLQKNPTDIPVRNTLHKLDIIIQVRKNGFSNLSHQMAQKIWRQMENYDTWYEKDLKLLGVILFHFPIETVQAITEKILDTLERYKDYSNIHLTQSVLLTNLSTIYLYHGLLSDCHKISRITYHLSKELKQYDKLAISCIRLGICQKDRKQIKKGLTLLELTEEKELLQSLTEEVKKYYPGYFSRELRTLI